DPFNVFSGRSTRRGKPHGAWKGPYMKATILLATLKKTGLSNTETLSEFLSRRMEQKGIQCEIVKLVNHEIPAGTYTNRGAGDEWPGILDKVLGSEIVIFATPIWWGNQSSEMQRVIERC